MYKSNQNGKIWLYDTTLRDGAQREGISLSLEDKLKIVHKLDNLGINFIEGGWPGANPKDVEFFWRLKQESLKQAEIVAFCSTRRPNQDPAKDRMLQAIISADTNWVTIFGKSWDLHVTEGLKTNLQENLAMIADTITYLVSQNKRVIYDAEHWFDGYKNNPEYAIATLKAAREAGAEWLVFCDTNGGTLPHEISEITTEVTGILTKESQKEIQLGIHAHNDSGTAVANSLEAVRSGITMVQGTINGYGERCGNANLCTLIPNLELKMGYDCLGETQLRQLAAMSRSVSEIVNLAPDEHAPFVGRSAFAHKGGIHVSAVERNPLTYEHIKPESIGNNRRVVISEQSGLSNVLAKARSFGIELTKDNAVAKEILAKLKNLESQGYQFEAAEASFELLIRQALGNRKEMFQLRGFQVHCDIFQGDIFKTDIFKTDIFKTEEYAKSNALATIKVAVNGKELLEVAEANGPVSALDLALRKALVKFYPEIASFHLSDYKVRILDGNKGTAAKTRVLVESSNGEERWTTLGVSTNILDASYLALVEGIEYGLLLANANSEGKIPESNYKSVLNYQC